MQIGLYKGYSSFEYQNKKTFKLQDIELVKMDLLNHIWTTKGERVMMPTFGTIIPELIFEPLDEEMIYTLREEIMTVIEFDPRVSLLEFAITPDFERNSVICRSKLLYLELNVTEDFDFNIQFSS